jgi:hypothetical protein
MAVTSIYPEYMTTAQAEAYSGMKDLAERRVRGNSPPFCKCGDGRNAKVIYSRKAIDEWFQARMRTSTSQHTALTQQGADAV